MNAFSIGISAISVGQRGLDVTGQNVANANTPGYHRQRVDLASLALDGKTGIGVEVKSVTRAESPAVRAAIVASNGEGGRLAARLDSQQQAETALASGTDSIGSRIDDFFNQAEQLTSNPEDPTTRRLLLTSAGDVAGRFRAAASDLDNLRSSIQNEAGRTVQQINGLASQIAALNVRIAAVEAPGGQANDLRDRRDQLIDTLSQLVDVRTQAQPFGVVNVIGPGAALVVGGIAGSLKASTDTSGQLVITSADSTAPLSVNGGKLGGLIEEHNQVLPAYLNRLDVLARTLIQNVNEVQATGLGTNGPFTTLAGTQGVTSATAPLSTAGLPFPVQAGQLAISVIDLASGNRSLVQVAFDPATQSLQDLANAITTGTGNRVQASVDAASGTLRFQAQAGFGFDFAGRLPTSPTAVAMNGSAVPTVAGTYTGTGNDTYSFRVLGTGTIGSTDGLQLEVRDSTNSVIATLNVGSGYVPGTALAVANGITVKLSAGTTDNGTFSVPVTGQPDTTGLLAALGVNGLFTGDRATNINVRPDLLADPSRLSLSRSGEPGDGTNVQRLAGVRDASLLAGGTQTLAQFHDALIGDVGSEVQNLSDQQTAQSGLKQNLVAQEQSAVGVDVNEESVNMVQYQRLIESSSRYLAIVNSALDDVLRIIQ